MFSAFSDPGVLYAVAVVAIMLSAALLTSQIFTGPKVWILSASLAFVFSGLFIFSLLIDRQTEAEKELADYMAARAQIEEQK